MDAFLGRHCGKIASYEILQEDDTASTNDFSQYAIYVMYKTNLFARIASASGSFWYPDFKEFVIANKPFKVPEKIYFSLGDKEAKTHNAFLKSVEENTRFLKNHFSQAGIKTTFELNVGNHFQDTTNRMAKGIAWILKE